MGKVIRKIVVPVVLSGIVLTGFGIQQKEIHDLKDEQQKTHETLVETSMDSVKRDVGLAKVQDENNKQLEQNEKPKHQLLNEAGKTIADKNGVLEGYEERKDTLAKGDE